MQIARYVKRKENVFGGECLDNLKRFLLQRCSCNLLVLRSSPVAMKLNLSRIYNEGFPAILPRRFSIKLTYPTIPYETSCNFCSHNASDFPSTFSIFIYKLRPGT